MIIYFSIMCSIFVDKQWVGVSWWNAAKKWKFNVIKSIKPTSEDIFCEKLMLWRGHEESTSLTDFTAIRSNKMNFKLAIKWLE